MPPPVELFSSAVLKAGDLLFKFSLERLTCRRSLSRARTGKSFLMLFHFYCHNISLFHHIVTSPTYSTLPFARPRWLNTVWPGKGLRKWDIDWTYSSSSLFRILFVYCFHFFLHSFIFFLIFSSPFYLSPLFLRSSEDPSFEAPLFQANIISLGLIR